MRGTFIVRGHKLRTQSNFRFQLVLVTDEYGARILGRTDSLAKARERIGKFYRRHGDVYVILDSTTGEEVR